MSVTTVPKGPESLERALAATLATHLPAELDGIWSAWAANDSADGLVIPNVHPVSVFAGERDELFEYPVVVVASEDGRQADNGAGEGWAQVDHHLIVVAYVAGDNQHTLDIVSKRYGQAIWEVLMKYQRLDGSDGSVVGVDPGEYGRSPTHKIGIEPGLLRMAAWSVTIHTLPSTSSGS